MFLGPRVERMISQEEWNIILELGSFFSIVVEWDNIRVNLDPQKKSFPKDVQTLTKMGFVSEPSDSNAQKTAKFKR